MGKGEPLRHVVIGGGIAGVCCAEELCRVAPDDHVTLISASGALKVARNVKRVTKLAEDFEVVDAGLGDLQHRNLEVIHAWVESLDLPGRRVMLKDGGSVPYDRLCIATGARPRLVADHPRVVTLRDAQSIDELRERLEGSRRVLLVGNGGIALGLAHTLRATGVVWVCKHDQIGDAFFDADAARFLQELITTDRASSAAADTSGAKEGLVGGGGGGGGGAGAGATTTREGRGRPYGHAVGPGWLASLRPSGAEGGGGGGGGAGGAELTVELECTLARVHDSPPPGHSEGGAGSQPYPVYAELSSGKVYGVDWVVSAAGVVPSAEWLGGCLATDAGDGGLVVDSMMRTSDACVFAAGDVATLPFTGDRPQWFQMRLWSQARLMGLFSAHCMCGRADELALGFNFELFTHVTQFLGRKVVLLGLYNGQHLEGVADEDVVTYVRSTGGEDPTFVRVLLARGRMQGAVMIGETGLEETFENLILNGLDLSVYGPELLDPDIDIDDYFD